MPFEQMGAPQRRIAIVGGGISGLAAAYALAPAHYVTLIEAAPRLGGHARTVTAGRRGDQPVDTGFIVMNRVNYPNLTALFDRLGVPLADSDMGFGVSVRGGRLEYSLKSVDAVLTQRRNALDPRFLRMLRDIMRFNARALDASEDEGLTIGALCERLGLGIWFRDYYLTPLSGAIWSTPTRGMLDFPARALVRFFRNHGLLAYSGQHQWMTVRGGSVEYVRRLEHWLTNAGVDIRTSARVSGVRRIPWGVEVRTEGGEWEFFDEVVFAAHADDALALLADATQSERAALTAIRYQPNEAVLHCDASVMPNRRKAWASWVYTEGAGGADAPISLSYWMNSLQPIPADDPMFVTLNPGAAIREEAIYDQTTFRHPVFDLAAMRAQEAIRAMNGSHNTWFCGAWMRHGFHEDGFATALDVAAGIEARARERLAA